MKQMWQKMVELTTLSLRREIDRFIEYYDFELRQKLKQHLNNEELNVLRREFKTRSEELMKIPDWKLINLEYATEIIVDQCFNIIKEPGVAEFIIRLNQRLNENDISTLGVDYEKIEGTEHYDPCNIVVYKSHGVFGTEWIQGEEGMKFTIPDELFSLAPALALSSFLEKLKTNIELVEKYANQDSLKHAKTNSEKLKIKLAEYGFFNLPSVKTLTDEAQEKLIEFLSTKGLPYSIAMLYFLDYLKYLEKHHFTIKDQLNNMNTEVQ